VVLPLLTTTPIRHVVGERNSSLAPRTQIIRHFFSG
jgi:hypothetical protein